MSGIVAAIRTDGEPVGREVIEGLAATLAPRGPDRRTTWLQGPAALGHALLSTGVEAGGDQQPFTLDGRTWIVADARIDARDDLVAQLGAAAGDWGPSASDAALILHAYSKWGDDCLARLLGDFGFIIWDSVARRLFCARDHMGVKPVFHARLGPWLLVSNSLACLRAHPAISTRLNDLAIADFLLFGYYTDPELTAFRDVNRLPAAHSLAWSGGHLAIRRYWTLPIEAPEYYRHDGDYVERFKELLDVAVADRLRTPRVGILMSGGIDSPALAAAAANLLRSGGATDAVHAFTWVQRSPPLDPEAEYAAMAAAAIGIPIHYHVQGREPGEADDSFTPEPVSSPGILRAERRCYEEMAGHSRVAFYGEGPDNALLYEWRAYLEYLWRKRRWGRMAADFRKLLVHHRRVPLLPGVPRLVRARIAARQHEPVFPRWLVPELIARFDLQDRWRLVNAKPGSGHPTRPVAYASLQSPLWQSVFESLEPCSTGAPLEVRHPYVDVRLLRYMLRVPVVPWCRRKHLVRCALAGVVPERVRRRPKTPLAESPDSVRAHGNAFPEDLPDDLASYASVRAWPHVSHPTSAELQADLRLLGLSRWLRALERGQGGVRTPQQSAGTTFVRR